MPEISRFYGVVIKMFFDDHRPPHFHAFYGEQEALIAIHTFAIIAGHLSPRAMGLVSEWAALHQQELQTDWDRAKALEPLQKIDPLP